MHGSNLRFDPRLSRAEREDLAKSGLPGMPSVSGRLLRHVYQAKFGDNPGPYEAEFKGRQKHKPVSEKHPDLLRIDLVSRKKDAGYFYHREARRAGTNRTNSTLWGGVGAAKRLSNSPRSFWCQRSRTFCFPVMPSSDQLTVTGRSSCPRLNKPTASEPSSRVLAQTSPLKAAMRRAGSPRES